MCTFVTKMRNLCFYFILMVNFVEIYMKDERGFPSAFPAHECIFIVSVLNVAVFLSIYIFYRKEIVDTPGISFLPREKSQSRKRDRPRFIYCVEKALVLACVREYLLMWT